MTLQIDRPLRAAVEVVVRCHAGLPVVVRVPPRLDDGTPFPTRYWLSCPLARRRVGRLEAAGGVAALERHVAASTELSARLEAAHLRYAAERDALLTGEGLRPAGGVAGIIGAGLKCLHAHYADYAAGNDNPAGELTAPFVEPLEGDEPCVVAAATGAVANPEWREPG